MLSFEGVGRNLGPFSKMGPSYSVTLFRPDQRRDLLKRRDLFKQTRSKERLVERKRIKLPSSE